MKKIVILFGLIVGIFIFLYFKNDEIVPYSPEDQITRFNSFKNHPKIDNWREWWHQNFYDSNSNISGKIFFNTGGNLNDPEKSIIVVYLTIYNESQILTNFIETFTLDEYESNINQKTIQMGPNTFKEITPEEYRIYLESNQKNTILNLTYKKITAGFTKRGLMGKNDVFWSVSMPLAEIEGYLFTENKKINLNGIGYIEHGHEIVTAVDWNWGLIADVKNEMSTVFLKGKIENEDKGILIVANKDNIILEMRYPDMDIEYQNFKTINNEIVSIPKKITGKTEEYTIEITTKPLIYQEFVDPYIIYYDGIIKKNDQVLYTIENSQGFYEHE